MSLLMTGLQGAYHQIPPKLHSCQCSMVRGRGRYKWNRCFYLLGLYCIPANHHTFPLNVENYQNADPNCAHQINVPTGRSLFHLLLES